MKFKFKAGDRVVEESGLEGKVLEPISDFVPSDGSKPRPAYVIQSDEGGSFIQFEELLELETATYGIPGITVLKYEDNGRTLIFGKKNLTTRISLVAGYSLDDIKEELAMERKTMAENKKMAENLEAENRAVRNMRGLTLKEKDSIIKGHYAQAKQYPIQKKIIIPFLERNVNWIEEQNERNAKKKKLSEPFTFHNLISSIPENSKNWAKYVAQHRDGSWWYYEDYPQVSRAGSDKMHGWYNKGKQTFSEFTSEPLDWDKKAYLISDLQKADSSPTPKPILTNDTMSNEKITKKNLREIEDEFLSYSRARNYYGAEISDQDELNGMVVGDMIRLEWGKYGYGVEESQQETDYEKLVEAAKEFNQKNKRGLHAHPERDDKFNRVSIFDKKYLEIEDEEEEEQKEEVKSENAAHYFHKDGKWYADSNFLNKVEGAFPQSHLHHIYSGNFALKGGNMGEIAFNRTEMPVDGFVGRTHSLIGAEKDIVAVITAMKEKKGAIEVGKATQAKPKGNNDMAIELLSLVIDLRNYGKDEDAKKIKSTSEFYSKNGYLDEDDREILYKLWQEGELKKYPLLKELIQKLRADEREKELRIGDRVGVINPTKDWFRDYKNETTGTVFRFDKKRPDLVYVISDSGHEWNLMKENWDRLEPRKDFGHLHFKEGDRVFTFGLPEEVTAYFTEGQPKIANPYQNRFGTVTHSQNEDVRVRLDGWFDDLSEGFMPANLIKITPTKKEDKSITKNKGKATETQPHHYQLGDKYSNDFDYEGMVVMAINVKELTRGQMMELYESAADVNYHNISRPLWKAIEAYKHQYTPEVGFQLEQVIKAAKEELKEIEARKQEFGDNAMDKGTEGLQPEKLNATYNLAAMWKDGKYIKQGDIELKGGAPGTISEILKEGKQVGTFYYDSDSDSFVTKLNGNTSEKMFDEIPQIMEYVTDFYAKKEGSSGTKEPLPRHERTKSKELVALWQAGKDIKRGDIELIGSGPGMEHKIVKNGKQVGRFYYERDGDTWNTQIDGADGEHYFDEIDQIMEYVLGYYGETAGKTPYEEDQSEVETDTEDLTELNEFFATATADADSPNQYEIHRLYTDYEKALADARSEEYVLLHGYIDDIEQVAEDNGVTVKELVDEIEDYGGWGSNFIVDSELLTDSSPKTCPPIKDGKPDITQIGLRALQVCIDDEGDTATRHKDSSGNYTPKRKRMHEQIVDEFRNQKPCINAPVKPIAVLTGGAPGSGKSHFLKGFAPWLNGDKVLHIDADEVRAKLPEYKGWNADNTHTETSHIVNLMLDSIGKPCTHDLVYDGTMNKAKKYLPLVDRLKKMGYEVLVIYMQVPKKVSMERVMERYQRTGRYVPYHVINEVYENGLEAYEEVIKAADGYIRVDGVTGKIIDKGGKPIPKERNYEDGSVSMKNHSSTGLAKGIAPGLYVKGKGGKKYNVNSLEELSAMWREVVNRELNLHARDTRMVEREIEIYNSKDEVVGRVSQNGKVWLGAHDGSSYDSNGKFQYTSPPLVYDPYAKEEEPCCEGCDKKDGSGCDEPKVTSPWVLLARARVQRVRILNLADSK